MLHVDIPTLADLRDLGSERTDACVSIYLETTPLTQHIGAARIELGNLARNARQQLEARGFDKRRLAALVAHLDDLAEDTSFWSVQANSLAVFVTADRIRTFRLANRLQSAVEVSDRFHLKPLLRAVILPHGAFVLAVSENAARLVEVFADLPPAEVKVDGLPRSAADAVGKASLNDRAPVGRIHGAEGQKVRFRQYLRQIDSALRPLLAGRDLPLILAAAEPLASLYREVNSYPGLRPEVISGSPDRTSEAELAAAARPILDAVHAEAVASARTVFSARGAEGRASADLALVARAATHGAVETLMMDMDVTVPGVLDETTGEVALAPDAGPLTYGVVDEIARRVLAAGGRVLAVRKSDLPDGAEHLAAILRYPA